VNNGWTGGQYSLYRAILGTYLLIQFLRLALSGGEFGAVSPLLDGFPNLFLLVDSQGFVTGSLLAGAGLSLFLVVGKFDRPAAIPLSYLWACLFGLNPLGVNPGLQLVGWLLLAHIFLPGAPFGSFAARGRIDPRGDWKMTPSIFAILWILLAFVYGYSGYTKLVSSSWIDGSVLLRVATWCALGLQLLYPPLALFRRARPLIWFVMVAVHLVTIVFLDVAGPAVGMLMFHLFVFDPDWIRPVRAGGPDMLFYDGACGLCHRTVRFVLAEDRTGETIRFAPLDSRAFHEAVPAGRRESLPDSVVVVSSDGAMRDRSTAIAYLLARLGGLWGVLSLLIRVVPRPIRDLVYDGVAAVRQRLFPIPDEVCPIMPDEFRGRWSLDS
jgi:predicted DCC family thiol-disulfide oxidoreductase YuxK